MKVTWSVNEDMDECPRCEASLITCGGGMLICPRCAAQELERLRKQLKGFAVSKKAVKQVKFVSTGGVVYEKHE